MDRMPMQTLQIYKKVEKIPTVVQIRRMMNECESVRMNYLLPKSMKPNAKPVEPEEIKVADPMEPPRVRSIEFQNTLMALDKKLAFWVNEYRNMIDEIREYERLRPSTEHDIDESDQQAQDNVDKIITVEEIKEEILSEFSNMCLRYEEVERNSRRKIKRLETELTGTKARVENLEYDLEKLRKRLQ